MKRKRQTQDLDREDVLRLCRPRYGRKNPERISNAFWEQMIRSGQGAYSVRRTWGIEADLGAKRQSGAQSSGQHNGPIWCFDRMGQAQVELEDGSVVLIGGEHEDWYDPDFCIYNDVVVRRPDRSVEIYGYPPSTFPPTDFHSATRVGGEIWLIGSVGYVDQRRYGDTPVYCLSLKNFSIKSVRTSGDLPGWIGHHEADYVASEKSIIVTGGTVAHDQDTWQSNSDAFVLSLATLRWTRA